MRCRRQEHGRNRHLEGFNDGQSGLKLNIDAELREGLTYELLLDFDAAKSIVRTGGPAGQGAGYILKPTIRVISDATSGAIRGVIQPVQAASLVSVIAGTDTLNTYADAASGGFLIRGVPFGTWPVILKSGTTAYRDSTVTGVQVRIGEIRDLGTVTLRAN